VRVGEGRRELTPKFALAYPTPPQKARSAQPELLSIPPDWLAARAEPQSPGKQMARRSASPPAAQSRDGPERPPMLLIVPKLVAPKLFAPQLAERRRAGLQAWQPEAP